MHKAFWTRSGPPPIEWQRLARLDELCTRYHCSARELRQMDEYTIALDDYLLTEMARIQNPKRTTGGGLNA